MVTRGERGSFQCIQLRIKNLEKVGTMGSTVLKRSVWYCLVEYSPVQMCMNKMN